MSNFKIKGIDKNAVTVNIGKIVTKPTFQSWFISVDFEPPQDKKTIPFAHVTHLVEGRALAATNAEHSSPDTASDVYEMEFTDVDPIVQPQSKKQHSRSVFVYKNGKTFIGIPMLELARALFFHNSYLSEAALSTSNTLDLEFDCQLEKNGHLAHIYALPHCRFPLALYEQEASRTHLSWILLDKNARTSFESIFKNLQEQKEYKKDWLSWYFRFNPPNLKGARIKLLGKLDPKLNTFVAKEIKSITNIPVNMPRQVKFYHPKFTRTADEKETKFRHLGQLPQVDIEIDTSLIATSVDKSIKLIDVPPASIGFATLFSTFKIAENIVDPKITIPKDSEEAATETETGGTAENIVTGEDRKFDWNSTTDLTDKSEDYWNQFESFQKMIEVLKAEYDFIELKRKVAPLAPMAKGNKHMKTDGSQRCVGLVYLSHNDQKYCFIEIDTTDIKKPLSTLVLKAVKDKPWGNIVPVIITTALQNYLSWPIDYIEKECVSARIPHPIVWDECDETEVIQKWAQRVIKWLNII